MVKLPNNQLCNHYNRAAIQCHHVKQGHFRSASSHIHDGLNIHKLKLLPYANLASLTAKLKMLYKWFISNL